ncbi:hypothetical protein GCM10022380_35600 [Amycolatopsis tucumanensis]|uniref:Uncharacterized protein n=1 Tax=Amycolatopsis tucumanensis TaxID=401106 RepID=A0ABP7IBQ5_9PSEU
MHEGVRRARGGLGQRVGSPAGQRDAVAGAQQRLRHVPSDARTGTRHDGDPTHAHLPLDAGPNPRPVGTFR